ncbi:hypothetical protein bwei_0100 [Bacillus mycoides]|nr:hypothetical protein bwei_0100 [Bacillus mycoides]
MGMKVSTYYCHFLSVNRYISKIADIFGVAVDIFEKSLI